MSGDKLPPGWTFDCEDLRLRDEHRVWRAVHGWSAVVTQFHPDKEFVANQAWSCVKRVCAEHGHFVAEPEVSWHDMAEDIIESKEPTDG